MKYIELIGFKAIELINQQIKDGIDIYGSRYSYSTKPFAMPAGNYPKFKKFVKKGYAQFFKRNGKLWMIVKGGYASWRLLHKRRIDANFLQWTGGMLKSMTSRVEGDKVIIGFTDPRASQLAYYLHESGVGKGRKKWRFFGLTKRNLDRLVEIAEENITFDDLINKS